MALPPKLCGDCGTQMDPVEEVFGLVGMAPTPHGLVFNTNRAYPVTVYLCSNCGRLKLMSAALLGNLIAPEAQGAQAPEELNHKFTVDPTEGEEKDATIH